MIYFDHEKLNVYQKTIEFIAWADELLQTISKSAAAKDHLDRASTSIALNIAEGNGKFTIKDRCRFLSTAYGSSVECGACLDVLQAKGLVDLERIRPGKEHLKAIVSMLVGLINSLSSRVAEDGAEYLTDDVFEYE